MFKSLFTLFSCCVVLCVGQLTFNEFLLKNSEVLNCRPDEEVRCISCPGETSCRYREELVSCLDWIRFCENKCVCKDGLLRSDEGECITNEQCDKARCPGNNEYFACAGACDNECATLDKQNKTNCPIESFGCEPRCYCDDGFARDDNDNCIPIEKCGSLAEKH